MESQESGERDARRCQSTLSVVRRGISTVYALILLLAVAQAGNAPLKQCGACGNDISTGCRPTPIDVSLSTCDQIPEQMKVRSSCSVPPPVDPTTVTKSCSRIGDHQVVNISWSLSDNMNRDAVTGYLISFFFEHGYADCSLLVPGFMQQEWYALYLHETFLNCLQSIESGSQDLKMLLSYIDSIKVTSLPVHESFSHGIDLQPIEIGPCFDDSTWESALSGVHQSCPVLTELANSTLSTQPSTTRIPSTGTNQVTTLSGSSTSSPSSHPPLLPGSSTNSPSSQPPLDKLESRGSGPSVEFLALLVVSATVLLAVCLGGLAYLLHKRAGLRSRLIRKCAAVTKAPLHTNSSPAMPPAHLHITPLPIDIAVELPRFTPPHSPPPPATAFTASTGSLSQTAAFTKPLPPTALSTGKSYVYISYARSDPHHRLAVQKMADWLHGCGVQVIADFYYPEEVCTAPQMFVERGIESAQHILIVWSPAYAQVWSQDVEETDEGWDMLQSPSLLTRWEVNLARVCLTSMSERNHQVIPVLLISDDDDSELPDVSNVLPVALQARRVYGLGSVAVNKDQLDLLRRLHNMW